ncbi:protein kinase [Dokdonella sp.]|uniref:protein kinase domain-containing protein n=1 Tax=Dokdonella sp. TaxID=2291710 RepID=UPI002608D97A|nr:protein kinase [Dokdonella sp.]
MTPDQWARLQALFDRVMELPETERSAWLADHEPNPELRAKVARLAHVHDASHGAGLTSPLAHAAADVVQSASPGQRIGAYALIREIGSGGMGTVFLAERVDDEFAQRVAIKLIRGIATDDTSRRLRRERQILAGLDHSNIARLFDGGTTDAGQPYLVMEYIDGESLTDYARSRVLPLDRRLRLLQQVCHAVHYAHRRLVIHRDLKPANVLIRADGTPALLDFGIAKLLDADTGQQQDTRTALPWFTPAYASPEQRKGRAVSTATDIYGLGALLHQLLTDAVPQPRADGTLPPPSTLRNAAGQPASDRELDIVVGKATHPDPERRYDSGAALAHDLERYLAGRPIQAAPDSAGYRLRKFVRRNRLAVAATAALAILATAFVWRLLAENERALRAEAIAHREASTSDRVVDYLVGLFDAASPEKVGHRPITAVELVDAGLRDLEGQLADQPRHKARLLAALAEIYAKLGQNEKGLAAVDEALRLQRPLDDSLHLARILQLQGTMLSDASRFSDAESSLREAIALMEAQAAPNAALSAKLATTLSLALGQIGRTEEAVANAERALEFAKQAGEQSSILLGEARNALVDILTVGGRIERAIAIARDNVLELEQSAASSMALQDARTYLARALAADGQLEEAEALLRARMAALRDLRDADSDRLLVARNELALVLRTRGKALEAIRLLRENLAALVARNEQTGSSLPSHVVITLNNLGQLTEAAGDFAESERLMREALRLAEGHDEIPAAYRDIYRQNLGRALLFSGRFEEAYPLLHREIADDGSMDSNGTHLRRLVHLAEWHRLNGQLDKAQDYAAQARQHLSRNFANGRAVVVLRAEALLARDRGDLAGAEPLLREALLIGARSGPLSNPVTELRLDLADVLVRLGRLDEARHLVESERVGIDEKFVPDAPPRRLLECLSATLGVPAA